MRKSFAPGDNEDLKELLKRAGIFLIAVILAFSLTTPGRRFFNEACYELGFNDRRDDRELLEIHFLDVGKADAIFIRCQGLTALIDAGKPVSADSVADYLLRNGVDHLDLLIMSHPDSDHIGGMEGVLSELKVGRFIRADAPYPSGAGTGLSRLRDVLDFRGVETISMPPGYSFRLGPALFTAVGPVDSFEDPNNSSLVLRMDCMGFSALFCGDMEKEAERALIQSGQDVDVDLLKVGHHGSNTSTTQEFVLAVSPKYAAIPTALDRNLLPRDEVLDRLEDAGAEIYRTDTDGNIVFIYDGSRVRVRLDKEEYADYETVDNRPF